MLTRDARDLPAQILSFTRTQLTTEILGSGESQHTHISHQLPSSHTILSQVSVPENGAVVDDAHSHCVQNITNIKVKVDCARRCAGEETADPRAINCAAFYYNSRTHHCILLHYFDARLGVAGKDGWQKFSLRR